MRNTTFLVVDVTMSILKQTNLWVHCFTDLVWVSQKCLPKRYKELHICIFNGMLTSNLSCICWKFEERFLMIPSIRFCPKHTSSQLCWDVSSSQDDQWTAFMVQYIVLRLFTSLNRVLRLFREVKILRTRGQTGSWDFLRHQNSLLISGPGFLKICTIAMGAGSRVPVPSAKTPFSTNFPPNF